MPLPSPSRTLPGRRAPGLALGLALGLRGLVGALVVGAVALSGCSSADDAAGPGGSGAVSAGSATTSAGSPASGSATSDPASDGTTLAITVKGTTVTPAPARVDLARGRTLRLVVTVDHDDELHAHGFDVEKQVTAGQPVTVDLTGGEPGLYEVELHHPELRLLQVLVR